MRNNVKLALSWLETELGNRRVVGAGDPEKIFRSNVLTSVDAGKCVLSRTKNPHSSTFGKIYCCRLKIALFKVRSLVIFKENTAPAAMDSCAY